MREKGLVTKLIDSDWQNKTKPSSWPRRPRLAVPGEDQLGQIFILARLGQPRAGHAIFVGRPVSSPRSDVGEHLRNGQAGTVHKFRLGLVRRFPSQRIGEAAQRQGNVLATGGRQYVAGLTPISEDLGDRESSPGGGIEFVVFGVIIFPPYFRGGGGDAGLALKPRFA